MDGLFVPKKMRNLVITLLLASSMFLNAEDNLRSGNPKDCFIFSWGKGPNWTAELSTEFQLDLLNRKMPYVDNQYSDPTEKAFMWIERRKEPTITTLASHEGRKIVQVVYPEKGFFGKTIGTILLAIETARGSDWFSPFFVAQPELYRGQFVSGRDVVFGYIATLEFSGTGSYRTHYLFDLRKTHPVILSTLSSGRVVRTEFETDREYEEALKVFAREADLLAGIIPEAAKPERIEEDKPDMATPNQPSD